MKADEIGGVVTGAKGPEAGVWVIAETRDLPTKYVKIVVTDDQGRYLIPGLAQGQLRRVGPRLWPGRFAAHEDRARQDGESEIRRRSERSRRRGILSGDLLVLDGEGPGGESVPRAPAPAATACRRR